LEPRRPGRPAGRRYDTPRTFELRAEDDATLNDLAQQWNCGKAEVVRRLIAEKRQQGEIKPVGENSPSAELLREADVLDVEADGALEAGLRVASSLRAHAATLREVAAQVAELERRVPPEE
jgi:hypothetical protein